MLCEAGIWSSGLVNQEAGGARRWHGRSQVRGRRCNHCHEQESKCGDIGWFGVAAVDRVAYGIRGRSAEQRWQELRGDTVRRHCYRLRGSCWSCRQERRHILLTDTEEQKKGINRTSERGTSGTYQGRHEFCTPFPDRSCQGPFGVSVHDREEWQLVT